VVSWLGWRDLKDKLSVVGCQAGDIWKIVVSCRLSGWRDLKNQLSVVGCQLSGWRHLKDQLSVVGCQAGDI
jgi:hypothetical protein